MAKITKEFVQNYFNKYCDWKEDYNSKTKFVEMLQNKCYFAKLNNKKVYAYDDVYTGDELEQMLIIADDF